MVGNRWKRRYLQRRCPWNGVLTVASGGLVNAIVSGGTINSGGSLPWLPAASIMCVSGFTLYGPAEQCGEPSILSNSPLAPFAGIWSYNDGRQLSREALSNQASGLINLSGDRTYLFHPTGRIRILLSIKAESSKVAGTQLKARWWRPS